jgi:peptide/nickel transport system permease protein
VLRYVVRRIPSVILTAIAASILIFVVMRLASGNPAEQVAGPDASPDQVAAIAASMGLDRPFVAQYWTWLSGLVTGDLGDSLINSQPIGELIGSRVESTLELALSAAILMSVLGIALGLFGGSARSARLRTFLDGLFAVLLSLPTFVTSVFILVLFEVAFNFLPISGEGLLSEDVVDAIRHLILPSIALSLPFAAVVGRMLQASVRDALQEDYVRSARAKGMSRRRIMWVHVLRNSMSTAVVVIGIRFGSLLGGAVIVEALFGRNGLGQLLINSVQSRDYFVTQDLIIFSVVATMLIQIVTELVLARLDPRTTLR